MIYTLCVLSSCSLASLFRRLKICEIRFRKPKWWEVKIGESPTALLEVSRRHKDHINMLVEATSAELFDMLPSLERLESGSDRLNTLCEEQATNKAARLGKVQNCKDLKHAYYCAVNGAIVDLVPKSKCIGSNRAWCAFQQSMITPCFYEDCLDPQERSNVPVRCEESHTAFGQHKEWVCGYRIPDDKDGDSKCDCSEMRKIETGLAHRVFMGVADWFRKNPWLVVGVAAVILATGICLAFPACMAMMGVQSSAIAGTSDTMSAMSETYGCGSDGVESLVARNPGQSAAGGGWYAADKAWVRGPNGRLTSTDPEQMLGELIGNSAGSAAGTVKNAASFFSRAVMKGMPSWIPTSDTARAVSEGMKTLGTSHPGMAFNPHYIKSGATIMIPPGCANFGKGVNYMAASAKIAGKFAGVLMAANAVFKVGRAIVQYLSTVGIKSYKDDFQTDSIFESSMPFRLQLKSTLKYLSTEGKVVAAESTKTLWRGENRQKDDTGNHQRLYKITTRTTTKGEMKTKYWVDADIDFGYGPGKCLHVVKDTLQVTECADGMKGTDWELKSNGMMCTDDCRQCIVQSDGRLTVERCGISTKKYDVRRLIGGGQYKLNEGIQYFIAVPASNTKVQVFSDAPSPLQWRRCNWSKDGQIFLNDEWPLITRSLTCETVEGCAFDDESGLCRALSTNVVL
mgnify:CR=1 FL=1